MKKESQYDPWESVENIEYRSSEELNSIKVANWKEFRVSNPPFF